MLRKIFPTVKDARHGSDEASTSQPDNLIILVIHLIDLLFDLCIYYVLMYLINNIFTCSYIL